MDSSDDELFNASPSCSKSIINTSLNLVTKQTNDLVQDSIKEKDCNNCLIKDISIKVARLSNEIKINNEETSTNLIKNRKRKRYRWKFGSCKKKKTLKKSLTQQMLQKQKPTTEVVELLENKIDDNARLYTQSRKIKEKSCIATQQDVQNVQDTQENIENLTLSTFEAQNEKEDLCIGKTYVCARILPYKFHQEKNTTIDNTTDIIADYNFSSSCMSTEQNLNSDKTHRYYLNSDNRHKFRKLAIQGELDEWKSERKRSLSTSSNELQLKRKRCRRISSDESSNDEIAFESHMKMIGDDNRNKSYSFYERMDEEKSLPNIQISREVHIVLMRLEEMNDIDVVKWRTRQNTLKIIKSEPVEEQLDKQKQVTLKANEHQINEITLSNESCDECNLWKTQDIQDLSQKSNTCVEKYNPVKLSNSLNMTKLRKKYKLFKKPKVLIIKLETLNYYSENGKYSATEIDRLTKKYINFVISSSSKPRKLLFYRLANLQRKNKTNMNVIRIENDETSYSLSDGQSVTKSFKQSYIDNNLIKGTILSNFMIYTINFSLIAKY